ncbi:MAG: hypothetical protein CMH55_07440 [Myxococcales bacterium]|nr:hypothetical protein [Myxococcales bacterium]
MIQYRRLPVPMGSGGTVYPTLVKSADHAVLIDTGTRGGFENLWQQLEEHLFLEARPLDAILMTHAHQDHYGGLQQLLERMTVPVICWQGAVEYYSAYPDALLRRAANVEELASRLGLSGPIYDQVISGYDRLAAQHGPVPIQSTLEDGDVFQLGDIQLSVHHHPGHHPHALIFVDVAQSLAVTGDNIFLKFRSPPGVEFDGSGRRVPCLPALSENLMRLAQLNLDRALPSHGPEIEDVAQVAEGSRNAYLRGAERLRPLIEHGQRPPIPELMRAAFGEVPLPYWGLRLGFLLGYLDLLGAGEAYR